MDTLLTDEEKGAINGLILLRRNFKRSRALRALDDWNGTARVMGGVGVSTMRASRYREKYPTLRGASCDGGDAPHPREDARQQ